MHIFCQPFWYTLRDLWLELTPSSRQCPDASRTNCCWWSVDTLWTLCGHCEHFSYFQLNWPSCWDGRPLQQNWPSLRHSPACAHKEAHQQNVGPRLSAFANLSGCQLLCSQLPTSGLSDVDQGSFHSCMGHSIRQKLFRAAIAVVAGRRRPTVPAAGLQPSPAFRETCWCLNLGKLDTKKKIKTAWKSKRVGNTVGCNLENWWKL